MTLVEGIWGRDADDTVDADIGGGGKAQMAEKHDPFRNRRVRLGSLVFADDGFVFNVQGQTRTVLFAATCEKQKDAPFGRTREFPTN